MATGQEAAEAIRIEVLDSAAALESFRLEWDALLECAQDVRVFVSWEWAYHWWLHYGKTQQLRVLVARRHGRLVGILPLYIQQATEYRLCPVRVLRQVGTGGDTSPDYMGPLLAPDEPLAAAAALADHVVNELPEWEVLQLSDLNPRSHFWSELNVRCASRGLRCTPSVSANMAYIELPPTWDEYLAAVHRDRRYTIRNTRRKFEAQGGRFYVHQAEAGIDEPLDNLIRLHHRRWQAAKVEQHAFSTPEYVGFHRAVVHACARRGWIRFYCIELAGAPVAVFYCYSFRGEISYFQAGFSPEHERLRPGLVLIGYAVEHAIKEGNRVFDFLRGEHDYKNQWGKCSRETYTLTAYRPGPGASLFRARTERIPALRRRVKRLLPFLRRGRTGHGATTRREDA
jgi:CelD/BcsL family acetyltransferase involved in cellulose biosynthesis